MAEWMSNKSEEKMSGTLSGSKLICSYKIVVNICAVDHFRIQYTQKVFEAFCTYPNTQEMLSTNSSVLHPYDWFLCIPLFEEDEDRITFGGTILGISGIL